MNNPYDVGRWPEIPLPPFQPIQCNHCYCHELTVEEVTDEAGVVDADRADKPHRQCCKCGDIMAEEFLRLVGDTNDDNSPGRRAAASNKLADIY